MRPTGRLHLGHLFGVLENWKKLQNSYQCYFFVADWHALTEDPKKSYEFKIYTEEMVMDWLAAGIDPDKTILFVQSWIPEHAELHMVFSMLTTVSRLTRMPTLKEYVARLQAEALRTQRKGLLEEIAAHAAQTLIHRAEELQDHPDREAILKAELKNRIVESIATSTEETEEDLSYGHLVSYGRLGYPVLQSADVLLYRPAFVPIGEDQSAHLELTREIARRFNRTYRKNVFPIPRPLFTEHRKVLGTDGRKMSKSYNNTILIGEGESSLHQKVRQMFTDPQKVRRNDPGRPEICPVFHLHRVVTPETTVQTIDQDCRSGALGCVECKNMLLGTLSPVMAHLRETRKIYEKQREGVWEILEEGTRQARAMALETMEDVFEAMRMPRPSPIYRESKSQGE